MSRSSALRKADTAFSLFIRTRDSQQWQGQFFRCISCHRLLPISKADCGHYINRQHMATRYSEDNCNAQCSKCNRFDEGNAQGYRQGLIDKIGEQRVILLEAMKHTTHRLTETDLNIIADHYRAETKKFPHPLRR